MSDTGRYWKMKNEVDEKVEIREIGAGGFFEYDDEAFQKLLVAVNLSDYVNECYKKVIALKLRTNEAVYFSDTDSHTKVKRLYVSSPLTLSYTKPQTQE